jgi:TRAP-type C4-dicarboxylate transport system permease large subunit
MVGLEPFAQTSFYTITALPLFVLMGTVVSAAGISKDLYESVRKWIGQVRGGLAMATAGACGLFAAICGDSIARR